MKSHVQVFVYCSKNSRSLQIWVSPDESCVCHEGLKVAVLSERELVLLINGYNWKECGLIWRDRVSFLSRSTPNLICPVF